MADLEITRPPGQLVREALREYFTGEDGAPTEKVLDDELRHLVNDSLRRSR